MFCFFRQPWCTCWPLPVASVFSPPSSAGANVSTSIKETSKNHSAHKSGESNHYNIWGTWKTSNHEKSVKINFLQSNIFWNLSVPIVHPPPLPLEISQFMLQKYFCYLKKQTHGNVFRGGQGEEWSIFSPIKTESNILYSSIRFRVSKDQQKVHELPPLKDGSRLSSTCMLTLPWIYKA